MNHSDLRRFAVTLGALGETFNETISDVRLDAYFMALSDLPIEAIEQATKAHIRDGRFFPRPIELRERIEGNASDHAEVAWMALMGEIRRVGYIGTPALPDATQRVIGAIWGSWRCLCETLPGDGPELLGWAKRFRETYATLARREHFAEIQAAPVRGMLES